MVPPNENETVYTINPPPPRPILYIGIPPPTPSELNSPMVSSPNYSDTVDAVNNPPPIPLIDNFPPPILTAGTHLICNEVWNSRIQDIGCKKALLSARTYQRAQIPPIGPEGDELYYYDLSCIAIDLIKIFNKQQELKQGRSHVPKNKTDVKKTIITRIMMLRRQDDHGRYCLKQEVFIGMMQNVWGKNAVDITPHHNDRVRLFGIIMSLPEYREVYQKLAEGMTSRHGLDSSELNNSQMFQNLAFAFNNEDVKVTIPEDAYDLENIEEINANDITRIRIHRDCMYL